MQEQAQSIEEILESLRNSVSQEVYQQIEEQMDQLREEIDRLKNNINDLAEKVKNLQEQLAACKSETVRLNKQVKDLEQEVASLQSELRACRQENANLEVENTQLEEKTQKLTDDLASSQQKIEDCENELRESNFMLISIRWETLKHDVDLWVIDPNDKKFNYGKKRHTGIKGFLSLDDTEGPGSEVFQIINAYPGKYKIYYHFYDRKGNTNQNPKVTCYLFYGKGAKVLPEKILSVAGSSTDLVHVLTVTVNPNGSFSF